MKGKKILAVSLAVAITMSGNGVVYGAQQAVSENAAVMAEIEEGDYTYTVEDGCATITGYMGDDEELVTPTTLGGYPVTQIGVSAFAEAEFSKATVSEGVTLVDDGAFRSNNNLEEIYFPSTMNVLGYGSVYDDIKLSSIVVSTNSPYFFCEDGVLFKWLNGEIILYEYPPAKANVEYVVPEYVDSFMIAAFSAMQNLRKICIPNTFKQMPSHAFCRGVHSLDVYLNHETAPYFTAEMFYNMPSGCHLIVKNQSVADALSTKGIFENTPDSSIVVMGTDDAYPAIPLTSLTWDGTNTTKSLLLTPGQAFYAGSAYQKLPYNSTDNITWSSSDEKIAKVDAVSGRVQASGMQNYPLKTGECTITGEAESGHKITLEVTVYKEVEDVELYCDSVNPEYYITEYHSEENGKWISFTVRPEQANNRENTVWKSSNIEVATVEKDETDAKYALLTFLSPGTTTITATLDDNGTIWTKSFVLTVTKKLSDCAVGRIFDQIYTGSDITPKITVMDGDKSLTEGTDYTVTYSKNKSVGMAEAVINGMGCYTGSCTKKFRIQAKDFSKDATVSAGEPDGKGDYQEANIAVKIDGVTLVKDTDYTLTRDSVSADGTASYTVTGRGNYTGTICGIMFKIAQPAGNQGNGNGAGNPNGGSQSGNSQGSGTNPALKSQTITGAASSYKKTYGAKAFVIPAKAQGSITFASDNTKVAKVDADTGKVTITGTGICTITITAAAKDDYRKAVKQVSLTVVPKKTVVIYKKSQKSGQLTVKWKKAGGADGYELQYSSSKKFTKKTTKTETIKKGKIVSKTLKALKQGKRYYVRVRAYKDVKQNGKTRAIYGSWSGKIYAVCKK